MRILITTLATSLVAFYSMTCRAEITEYDIEIVFFEDATNRYSNSEQWPKIELELLSDSEIPIKTGDTADTRPSNKDPIANVTEKKVNSLKKYITGLERSTRYNVLTYKAWRQTGLDAESAIDIYIDSTKNKASLNKKTNITNSSIQGTVKIVLGRYLHVYTDMIYKKLTSFYTQPEPAIDNKWDRQRYKEYSIKSHRRMRSNELHYIDHPLVGILVMAQPVKLPETEIRDGN